MKRTTVMTFEGVETSRGARKNARRRGSKRVCCVFLTAGKRPKEPGDVMGYGYRLQKFRYSYNGLSQRHSPPESHISSLLSPPHKTEGEELKGKKSHKGAEQAPTSP